MSQTLNPATAEVPGLMVTRQPGRHGAAAPDHRVSQMVNVRFGSPFHIEPWVDPVVDEVGHDPRSAYAETYWLPILGPSVTWMLRRFATYLDEAPHGTDLSPEDLARSLGIGERSGPNGPLPRTLKRCVDFEMAEWRDTSLAVRRKLPPLARRHLRRLPETLQARYFEEVESRPAPNATERLRAHGCRLALSLMAFGEDRAAAEQQLVRWGLHPALASSCATWAGLEYAKRTSSRLAHPAGSARPAP